MVTTKQLMTVDDLMGVPKDGWRYELIRGEIIKMAPAGHTHGRYASRIDRRLGTYAEDNNLGESYVADAGFRLATDPDHVRVPDVAFVRRERVEAVGDAPGYFPGAPDLVVEVISPNDRYTEVDEKVADWLAAGTRMVIVVNPRNRTVKVHTPDGMRELTETDTIDGSDVAPGWRMAVADIFA